MSRSNDVELTNPANRFIEFVGSDGSLRYWDKTLGEKGENVGVDIPFKFLILDRVYQITGGVDQDGGYQGFWSNAIKNLKTQQFVVRSKGGVVVQGYYDQIKGTPGVKFMIGLYIAAKGADGALQIDYLKIKGSGLSAWIDFIKAHRSLYHGAFSISGSNKKKKGTTDYFEPVFEFHAEVPEAVNASAVELDVQLQEYLTAYFANNGIAEVERELVTPEYSGTTIDNEYEVDADEVAERDAIQNEVAASAGGTW